VTGRYSSLVPYTPGFYPVINGYSSNEVHNEPP
jgi:hypothetical protein